MSRTLFRAAREPWSGRIELRIGSDPDGRGASHVAEITFRPIHPAEYAEPSITLSVDEAQVLIDELWHVGMRPSEGTGSAGSLAATERHLADMQRVAFGALKRQGFVE